MVADRYLTALERHLSQRGHFPVSRHTDPKLYHWGVRQRQLWHLGQIDYQLERKLRALGFPLEVDDCEWEHSFATVVSLFKYRAHLPSPGSRSAPWLQEQRELFYAGTLPRNREERLRAIGAFDESSAADTVATQIKDPGKGGSSRSLRHDVPGAKPVPSLPSDDQARWYGDWDACVAGLRALRDQGVLVSVGAVSKEDEVLAKWLNLMRTKRKRGQLSDAQIEELTALGFRWTTSDTTFEKAFRLLQEFKRLHGHMVIPKSNQRLWLWACRLSKLEKLPPDQAARLK